MWASSVLFKFGGFTGMHFKVSNDNANSVVMALKAKGSTKYGRASGRFTGKGEGAREYLGDLLM